MTRERSLANLDPPEVLLALPDIPGGEENLLPLTALSQDLKVIFVQWPITGPTPDEPERLRLYWDDVDVAGREWTSGIRPDDLFVILPRRYLADEGPHRLMYIVTLGNNNPAPSGEITITIDKTPPVLAGTRDPLGFPIDLIGNTVTARYLEDHGNKLSASVPLYDTPKPGDRINFYWEVGAADGLLLAGYKELTQSDMSLDIEFDGDMIVSGGDGERWASYEVLDRAGNISFLSRGVKLTVDAQPVPLTPPSVERSVPTRDLTGELDPLLVTGGAVVVVPSEIDPQPGDTITVYWDGVVPSASHETSTPITAGGFRFAIPASKIPGNIGRNKVVVVYYTLTKQGSTDAQPSGKYLLTILPIPENRFPKPQCLQASGTPATLRLSSVPNGANFRLDPWVFIAAGQKMHMWIEGVNKTDGSDLFLDVFTERQVTEAETTTRVEMLLPRSYLEQLRVNSVFWADIEVSFDGGVSFIGFARQDLTLRD